MSTVVMPPLSRADRGRLGHGPADACAQLVGVQQVACRIPDASCDTPPMDRLPNGPRRTCGRRRPSGPHSARRRAPVDIPGGLGQADGGNGHKVMGRNEPMETPSSRSSSTTRSTKTESCRTTRRGSPPPRPGRSRSVLGPLDLGVLVGDGDPGLVRPGPGVLACPGPSPDLAGLPRPLIVPSSAQWSLDGNGPKSSSPRPIPTEVWAIT